MTNTKKLAQIYERVLLRIPVGGHKIIAGRRVDRGTPTLDSRFADRSNLFCVSDCEWLSSQQIALYLAQQQENNNDRL